MSSDYIPRLRQELLRAGATKPSRWTYAERAVRPLAAAAAVALVVVAVVLAFPRGPRAAERDDHEGLGRPQLPRRPLRLGVRGAGDARAARDRGRLAIYDWERSVLGPRAEPAAGDAKVTGGQDAGRAAAISKAEADKRDGQVVRALGGATGWFALGGEPALTNADIERVRADVDPMTREPVVLIDLTADGRKAFTELTRRLANRGAADATPASGLEAAQHLAIVVDDRIASAPYIDFRQAPDGIDGATGVQIAGGLTPETARQLAALLSAGPLAAPLQPAG